MDIRKKEYAKPELKTIELKAEEVLVAGCKTNIRSNPLGVDCVVKKCSGLGS